MAEITLNRQHSELLLASSTDAGTRLVAALAIAFFEATDSAEGADRASIAIALKLLHMIQTAVYEAAEAPQEGS